MLASGSIGDTWTSTDDVFIDGRIITGENFHSAARFGEVVATQILAANAEPPDEGGDQTESQPKPVLMVIAKSRLLSS